MHIPPETCLICMLVPLQDSQANGLCLCLQMPQYMQSPECNWRDYCPEQPSLPELAFTQCPCPPRSLSWQPTSMENGTPLTSFSKKENSSSNRQVTALLTFYRVLVLSSLVCLPSACAGYQLRASIYSYGPTDSQPAPPFTLDASIRSAEPFTGTLLKVRKSLAAL